ncbi:MAG: pyridoxamine 5'-phosphate oxidase family protein [bacterium]|nr:pyridoxamine 5'-phosphate oxidase family protein [bacterium]
MAQHDTNGTNGTHDEPNKKLSEMIKDVNIAMLTTIAPDGTLNSRPMGTQDAEFDGDLWFFTEVETGKVHDVEQNPNVNVSYASDTKWISVAGQAQIVRDRAKIDQYWQESLKVFFPEGKDTPNLVLIKVEATQAQYWTSPGRVASALEFARAFVTGDEYQAGKNEKIDFK